MIIDIKLRRNTLQPLLKGKEIRDSTRSRPLAALKDLWKKIRNEDKALCLLCSEISSSEEVDLAYGSNKTVGDCCRSLQHWLDFLVYSCVFVLLTYVQS